MARFSNYLMVSAAMAAALIVDVASAQTADSQVAPLPENTAEASAETPSEDIVVTGTLLRGIAPTGTNVIGVTREDVTKTGLSNSNDLLARIPQVANSFNQLPTPTADQALPINRPNLRDLGASGGSTTLVLLNGRRLVGQGVLQTSVDPSIISPGVIERVDVIPDGGSSIYGSDAIGGVINLITRKRLNGVEVNGRYGFADHYQTVSADATAGRDWGSGSLLLSYSYAWHDNIMGADRDYISQNRSSRGGANELAKTCSPGNITAGGINYALPGRQVGTNFCDEAKQIDFYPRETRHSVFASLTQELNSSITFNATAYWSLRDTMTIGFGATNGTGLRGTGTITAANPYFQSIAGETSQTVAFSLSPIARGNAGKGLARLDSYGVTPGFDIKLGDNWQVRAGANFGRSGTRTDAYQANATAIAQALAGTTTATALNPYNLSASDPAVIARVNDYAQSGRSVQEIAEMRVVADGTLASLPGGEVRLAVGGEYHYEDYSVTQTAGRVGANEALSSGFSERNVKSVFGEILVPIFGTGNSVPGLQSLELSGSVRYDDYDDVGGTTNPKIGFNYKPVNSLRIRGNWGTSFHAPSLADNGAGVAQQAQILAVSPFRAAGSPFTDLFRPTVVLAGGDVNLKPETAKTWSIGADYKPEFARGLTIGATYWNVFFKQAIGLAPFYTGSTYFANTGYSGFYTINPTLAQVQALVGNATVIGAPSLASLYNGTSPYVVFDARRKNLGQIKQSGIDYNISYAGTTSWGGYNAGVGGSYVLQRKSSPVAGSAFLDDLKNGYGRLSLVGSAGLNIGGLSTQVSANYKDGYPVLGDATQTDVKSFTTVNLFASYTLAEEGALRDTALTINVDNILDTNPPYRNVFSGVAYTNIGRVITVGLRKKF